MDEVDPGLHTIQSHGPQVARQYIHDWILLVLLGILELILYVVIDPFYRYVGRDMMTDLKYPMKATTIPFWAVPLYAVVLPIVIFLVYYYRRRDVYDLHHGILGILFAVLVTGVLTDALKDAVGRPRPDFFWRCFPDGIENYDRFGNVRCHGRENVIKEGHKSFPSGHTSWSFAGMIFLALYLLGKIRAFDRRGHIAKLCAFFFPLLLACFVGISLVDDYMHHWDDVVVGGLLGLFIGTLCYLQFFPPPYHIEGWGPYAYFRAMEELRLNPNLVNHVNGAAAQTQLSAVNTNIVAPPQTASRVDDVESGRIN